MRVYNNAETALRERREEQSVMTDNIMSDSHPGDI